MAVQRVRWVHVSDVQDARNVQVQGVRVVGCGMKYQQKTFSVNVGDTEEYRRNYDRIFRKKKRVTKSVSARKQDG